MKDYRQGIRKASPIASCVAAATPVTLYTLPAGRTCVIRKVHIFNGNAAATLVQIGTGLGAGYAQQIPSIYAVNGMDLELRQDDLPASEFTATLTVQATVAAAAPNNVQVMVEVEEYQGPTG